MTDDDAAPNSSAADGCHSDRETSAGRVDETDETGKAGEDDDSDDSLDARTRRLHDHLAATAELSIERGANRWLGEAEAIAADVATSDLPATTTRERVATIRDLLSEIDDLDHEAARCHVEAARRLCAAIIDA